MADEHVIEIEKLAISLTTKWNCDQLGERSAKNETCRPLIHRINAQTCDRNKHAHEPMMLSIGPYNYHLPATHALQTTKYELLNYVLNLNHEKSLVDYLDGMKKIEKQVRICYGDEINMDRIDFLKMLLLDGSFVLVILCGQDGLMPKVQEYAETSRACDISMPSDNQHLVTNEELVPDETILQTSRSCATDEGHQENSCSIDELYSQDLWHDILLLENQLPFVVIIKIHDLIVGGSNARTSKLVEHIIEMVEYVLGCYPGSISRSNQPKEFYHLLHMCHEYFRPRSTEVEVSENHVQSPIHNFRPLGRNVVSSSYMPSVTTRNLVAGLEPSPWRRAAEYHRAGINFKKRDFCSENPHSLLDIAFHDGVLEIPCLMIDPNTQALFCNLIAFEQTCAQFGCYFTSYVVFLSSLIIMPEDVLLLTEKGIIVHQLNNEDEVSNLIRVISECVGHYIDIDNYLKPLCNEIEAYYQTQRPVIRDLLGSMTSSIHRWIQISKSSDLPVTSRESPI